jgi:hypothetical protein
MMTVSGEVKHGATGLPMLMIAALCATIPCHASAQSRNSASPARRSARSAQTQTAFDRGTLSAPQSASPQPAAVILKNGTLTIHADNSDLDQILRDISRESGMVIEGQVGDTRVYGSYGPRKPDEILNELLTGLGYNVMMLGRSPDGAPRELTLTRRTGGPTPPPPPSAQPVEEPKLGPGAVAHPPTAQIDDPDLRRQVNLRRLQQMHDTQEKQEKENERR